MSCSIAVITFTVSRTRSLLRAVCSVDNQLGMLSIKHYIFVPYTTKYLLPSEVCRKAIVVDYDTYGLPDYLPEKMAILRSRSLNFIDEDYVCFLDDDNEFSNIHLLSLYNLVKGQDNTCSHSLRFLSFPDGSLFKGDFYPWSNETTHSSEMYQKSIELGIIKPNDPIIYDGINRIRSADEFEECTTVDMNEWLFPVEIIRKVGFETDFSEKDKKRCRGEDDKLLTRLMRSNVDIVSSGLPTVRYFLGGFSNSDHDKVRQFIYEHVLMKGTTPPSTGQCE